MNENEKNLFLFVLWSAARGFERQIVEEIGRRFTIVRSFEVAWPKRHFTRNLASFYGWKSWRVWWNKARKCGTGPFLAIVVEDPNPVWKRECDTFGHVMTVDENVYQLKKSFRALTGRSNIVHSSVTLDETAHQLAALAEPQDSPIPFRRMFYADDARIRAERRGVWLGFFADLLIPLLASAAAGTIVWTDLFVLKTAGAENHLAGWSGLAISLLCGIAMTACAFRRRLGRGAYALLAAVFFAMTVREAAPILDRASCAHAWPWLLTAVTLPFVGATFRHAKTVYPGLKVLRSSRFFPLFAAGASLTILASILLGHPQTWQALGVCVAPSSCRLMEESFSLFGYALMFAWTLSHVCRRRLR